MVSKAVIILILVIGIISLSGILFLYSSSNTNPINPIIKQIIPPRAHVNAEITIKGSGFSTSGNTIILTAQNSLAGSISDLSSPDGTTLTFTVPDGLALCSPANLRNKRPCPGGYPRTLPGIYNVSVVTDNGASNSVEFEIL